MVKKNTFRISSFKGQRLYHFFMKIKPFTGRYAFLFVCLVSLIWYALYTRSIIDRLQQNAVNVTRTYAELMRSAISENMDYGEMNVIFEEIIQKSQNPIIITDTAWQPLMWKNITAGRFWKTTELAPEDTSAAGRALLQRKITEFRRLYEPKPLQISETQTRIGYLVFGNNRLVDSLKWIPIIEIVIISLFVVFAYFAFHNIRITERSNLWVGLAKETAHQLGTPLSSLMGWVEFLRSTSEDDEDFDAHEFMKQVHRICDDMDNDLTRLRKVTNRFSQIGSMPTLTPCDINNVLQDAKKYLAMRLPLLSKRIEIKTAYGALPPVEANRDLLEWVFENLMKNAADAIRRDDGLIEIKTEYIEVDRLIRIQHTDNGQGISWEDQKKIFSPGYTTKKRGWGLGLTLAKRIIEDYHDGRIYVSWSQKGKGTTFCLDLPVKQKA